MDRRALRRRPKYVPSNMGISGYAISRSAVNARWSGLTAGWKLDESSDGSAPVTRVDVLGSYDLTDNNTTPSTTGLLGNAIIPASVNHESLENATVPTFTGAVTVCLWVKRTGNMASVGGLVGRYNGVLASSSFLVYANAATTVTCLTVSSAPLQSTATGSLTLVLNTWHMLTFRRPSGAGQAATLILDDSASSVSTAAVAQPAPGSVPFEIGSTNLAQDANNVIIDNVYYFADVLKDDAWITGMYNSGAGKAYPS